MKTIPRQFKMSYFFVYLALTLAVSPAQAQTQSKEAEKILNFYNWADYVAPDTLSNFTKETGIKVRNDTFESSETLNTKLVLGHSGYDIVISSSVWAPMQAAGGLLLPLDNSKLPNLKNLDPSIQAQIAKVDPSHRYMVSWLWGYDTIGINADKVKKALGSLPMPDNAWDLIFKPQYISKLKSCGVSILDSPTEVVPAALHYLGKPLDSNNVADYAAATALLKSIRPSVTLITTDGYVDGLVNGSLCVAMGWSGDLSRAKRTAIENKTGQNIQVLMPTTGGLMFFDTMVIPIDAPHSANAHKFINYILRPEVHANLTNSLNFGSPNLAAHKYIKTEVLNDSAIFPNQSDIAKMDVQGALKSDVRRMMTRVYTKFKTGY